MIHPNLKSPKDYYQIILDQYLLYAEMADRIRIRRSQCNKLFLALQSALIAAFVIFLKQHSEKTEPWWLVPLSANFIVCLTWRRSYQQLNSAKYKVIGALENLLPISPFGRAEWKILGEGKVKKQYYELTKVEGMIPLIFIGMFIIFPIFSC